VKSLSPNRPLSYLRHESGLSFFRKSISKEQTTTENIKRNALGEVIEEEEPHWPNSGTKRMYHGISRGWILNEIFRRVDSGGRTVGEFLKEDVKGKLDADIFLGHQAGRKQDEPKMLSVAAVMLGSLLPNFISNKVETKLPKMISMMGAIK